MTAEPRAVPETFAFTCGDCGHCWEATFQVMFFTDPTDTTGLTTQEYVDEGEGPQVTPRRRDLPQVRRADGACAGGLASPSGPAARNTSPSLRTSTARTSRTSRTGTPAPGGRAALTYP